MRFRSYNQPKMVNCLYDFAATQNLIQKHQALVIQLHSDKLTLAMENPHLSLVNTIIFFLICYGYALKIIEIYSNAIKTYTTAAKTQYVPSFQAPWLLARQKRHVSVGGFEAMATLLTFNELIRHRNTQQRSSSAESQKTWESLNKFAPLDSIGLTVLLKQPTTTFIVSCNTFPDLFSFARTWFALSERISMGLSVLSYPSKLDNLYAFLQVPPHRRGEMASYTWVRWLVHREPCGSTAANGEKRTGNPRQLLTSIIQ